MVSWRMVGKPGDGILVFYFRYHPPRRPKPIEFEVNNEISHEIRRIKAPPGCYSNQKAGLTDYIIDHIPVAMGKMQDSYQ